MIAVRWSGEGVEVATKKRRLGRVVRLTRAEKRLATYGVWARMYGDGSGPTFRDIAEVTGFGKSTIQRGVRRIQEAQAALKGGAA